VSIDSGSAKKARVVWITRRFWPLVGGAERMIGYLASAWVEQGGRSILLTAQWTPSWSREMQFHGVSVLRLPQPKIRFWGTLRYMQSLGRWLRQNRDQYDCVCVSMLKHDAYAAVRAVGGKRPILLRAEGAGRTGDCYWQLEARCGRKLKYRLMHADAFIGPSETIYRELQAAGYPRSRIHYIPNGVPIPPPADAMRKQSARAALAALHLFLQSLAGTGPQGSRPILAVYTGRLHPAKGLAELLRAWERIRLWRPEAQLCLAGEGPMRAELESQIGERKLAGRVHLLGPFDSVEDLLAAADVFILPSYEEGMSLSLLEAMAAGLPIVATDIPGNRSLIRDGQEGLLTPPGNVEALTAAILRLLSQPSLAEQLGRAARQRAETEFSLDRCLQQHQALWDSLLQKSPSEHGSDPKA
jgi:glycosyltransferase involved in cell wall biosynthesis